MTLTPDQRARWARVGERIIELGPGTHAIVKRAIEDTIPRPTDPLHAAETCLNELDNLPGEPDALETP